MSFLPFSMSVEFVKKMCEIRNDPAFSLNKLATSKKRKQGRCSALHVHSRKSEVNYSRIILNTSVMVFEVNHLLSVKIPPKHVIVQNIQLSCNVINLRLKIDLVARLYWSMSSSKMSKRSLFVYMPF